MQENKNSSFCQGKDKEQSQSPSAVCIDTKRVLDSCRDRDCFENARVYLTASGEEILANASNVRVRYAKLLWAYVGVNEVPFNCGFYQITVRYYIEVELEGCVAVGRSQTFRGLAALEKDVVLYGGEGRAISFSSESSQGYCDGYNLNNVSTNAPVAIVETVEPVVLGVKVVDCNCPCPCSCTSLADIPEGIRDAFGEELVLDSEGAKVYVSFGIFSVIRIVRPAQLLVTATDYSVPEKECTAAQNDDNPCSLFRSIAFPVSQFKGTDCCSTNEPPRRSGGCGCGR